MYVLLLGEDGKKYVVELAKGMQAVHDLGVVNTDALAEAGVNKKIEILGKRFLVLEPQPVDYIEIIKRKTQIILPKDSAYIIVKCGISPGKKVVEIGSGVGALTIFLASIVGSAGKIYAYERRREHILEMQKNLNKLGLGHIVESIEQDAEQGIAQCNVDAVVCDIPEPWKIMHEIYRALKIGCWCACYLPTYNQVERCAVSMRDTGFGFIECNEILMRQICVAEGAVRPDFSMLGHTGFLLFGRKI